MYIYDQEENHDFWVKIEDDLEESEFYEENAWEDLYALEEVDFNYFDALTWICFLNCKEFFENSKYDITDRNDWNKENISILKFFLDT